MNRLFRTPDGQSGLFFTGFGVLIAIGALQYPLGTPGQMGAGFFPFWLGLLLALVGVIVLLQAMRSEQDAMLPIDWRALGIITGAIVLSGLLLRPAGLLVSIPVLVIVSSFASRNLKPLAVIITAIVLTAMAYVIFILGLDLRIPLIWC